MIVIDPWFTDLLDRVAEEILRARHPSDAAGDWTLQGRPSYYDRTWTFKKYRLKTDETFEESITLAEVFTVLIKEP